VEGQPVIELFGDQLHEVGHRAGRFLGEQFDVDIALAGLQLHTGHGRSLVKPPA
jgi:hypothetical protein